MTTRWYGGLGNLLFEKSSVFLNEMLLLACIKQHPFYGVSRQLHKCGMNFSFFTDSLCKMRPCLLQTQVLVCSDQIIALMILARSDNRN